MLVVGVLEGVEVLAAGVAEVDVGVRLTLETPNSGLLGVDGSAVDGVEAAFVMAVLEDGELEILKFELSKNTLETWKPERQELLTRWSSD